jgi:8-oxo-dGTP pyrophosphatase MutT (NUDIX family)
MIAGLLAPNGKPSNLTLEQYLLVRTDAFKEWFGDWEKLALTKVYDSAIDEVSLKRLEDAVSKVVDSNGEPLVLYHGTDVNFNVYDLTKIGEGSDLLGKGIYLTEKKDVANFYANLVGQKRYIIKYEKGIFDSENPIYEKDADKKAEKHKVIYQFFVNAKNVVDINKIEVDNNIKQILIKSISDLFEEKSEEYVNDKIDFANKNYKEIRNYRGMLLYLIYLFPDSKEEVLQYIKNKYDCIIFEPSTEFETDLGEYKNYVVFNPEQIKLADGSNTTFDSNNPDIRFYEGGEARPFTDDGNKFIVFSEYRNHIPYKISVDDVSDAQYIALWRTNINTGLDKKVGTLKLHKTSDDFLNVSYIYIDAGNKGLGLGLEMYKIALKYSDEKIKGIKSYLPIRSNKKQIPKIYKKLNSVTEYFTWDFIYKKNNPDIRFDEGGEAQLNEEAQQYIDIISMNPKLEKYQKYKVILKDKFGIDFDSIYKDQEYIHNANLNDIKKQGDFLDFGNWLDYAKIISKKRGFVPMDLYATPSDKYKLTDEIWNETSKNLDFIIKKIPYTERGTGSGDIARAFGDTIYYTDHADFYYFLHELGHIYDFKNNIKGIIKNPAYSPTNYGTTNGGETFAENFAIYFINPMALKNWNEDVYNAMDSEINEKYKNEINRIMPNNPDIRFNDGGVIVNPTEIECHNCHWHWKVKDGGDDLFICHKCNYDNSKFYEFKGLEGERILDTISYKKGGRTISQTPAPKKDRIYGSDKNKEGSSKDLKSAKTIELSDNTIEAIKNKVDKHNKKHSNKKITIDSAKAVVRRGMGAYSSSHRPTISGGNENSRVAWGLARLNAFLFKIVNGKSKSGKYSQDNDLIEELGYKVQKYEIGGIFQGTPHDFEKYSTEYIGTGEGQQVFGWGLYFTDIKDIAKNYAKNELLIQKEIVRKSDNPSHLWIYTNISDNVVDKLGYLKIKLKEFEELKKEYKKDIWDDKIENYSTLIDIIQNYQGKIYSVTLFKKKNPNDYELLNWEEKPKKEHIDLILNQLEKEKIVVKRDLGKGEEGRFRGEALTKILNNEPTDYTGGTKNSNLYTELSSFLGGDKEASLFLLRAGIDGIKYKSGTLSGMKDKEGYNYVIFDADDITIENKEKFADGGDIQAYEEAMGISEFDEGGEAKPKKVYVSIRLQSKRENIINEDRIWRGDRFTIFEEKTFEELKNHQLIGIRGVSLSPNNIGDWFSYKDCLVVMNYDEFFKLNDATKVKYDDPYQLMENDLKIFNRLYGNSEYTDEREKKITRGENLKKIIEKLPFYFDKAKYEYYYDDAQKRDELTRYYMAIGNFGYKFVDWIIKNDYIINNPNELVEKIIQFTHLPDSESGIDYYYRYGLEKYVLTAEDIFPIVMKGLIKAGSTYTDEAEVIINNKLLNLPNNTQLFFKKEDFEKSDLQDLIDKYELNQTYRVYSIKSQYIKEYQDKLLAKRTKRDVSKWELGKEQLEIKKELVLNDLQKLFFDKSLNKINKILDEKYPLKYYLDWEGDKTKYYRWNEVIEVQFLLNKFFEITLRDWKSVFRTKRANEIYSTSFYALYNSIDYFFRQFIEQNRDYLETINKFHNENGDTLWVYDIERAVLDMVNNTYEEENGISYLQLAKRYFQMIGGELTSYYKQDEIVMPSIYKDGGETDEPTYFWGKEAGGVLVYCSTTQRYLILLRSDDVLEPNTWGIISGKLDDEENVQEAVLREAEEETGYKLGTLIPSFVFEKPNFKFHNFVSIVDKEFVPELNWENTDYKWVKLNEMPDNLHFGLKLLIEKEDLPKLVEKNNNMNKNQNPKDTITMDIPLLIRYSELMREDIKSDVALHQIVENLIEIKDMGVLTMSDYDSIVGNVIGTEENPEMESKFEDGGKVNSIKSKKGDIKISLDENWYSDDTDVELVPVSELIKFREFDRKVKPKYNQDNSRDNINHLKYMFQRDGVKEPIIIEYSPESNSVLVIEGNHRINSAIDLGMEYLPARVVLKKYGNFNANQLKNTISVSGVTADEYGYIPSNLKPSKVGIQGAIPIVYGDGGIIEGRLHSECGDDGCGRKFQVGEGGHIIEAERDEAVIVADAFNDNEKYTIKGTPSEVASALNVMGGGKNFDKGAEIVKNGQQLNMPDLKKQAVDTDVDDVIDGGSIIINRRTMADEKQYEVTGTPKQIASAINSLDGNGVVIENGGTIKKG